MRGIDLRYASGLVLLLLASRVTAADPPTLVVRDITTLAGQSFQMPLHGGDANNSPLAFSLVSISDTNVTGYLTSGNRSLRLSVTGKDANTNDFAGDLVFELFEDLTSNTTARIITLVETNFYNGLTFHRIINNFVAQGGDPNGNGTGGSGVKFKDEFNVQLTFTGFGQLAMANSGDDSNDSQFFVTDNHLGWTTNPPPAHLNFNYTIFGQLTSGFDVLDTMMRTPVGGTDGTTPVFPVTITSATIFTNRSDAVLRLSAARGSTGTVTVTVSAMNTNQVTTQTSFLVTVIPDPLNNRPFLEPLPDLVTGGVVHLIAIDLENDALTPIAEPQAGLQAVFNASLQSYLFVPDPGATGTVTVLFGVWDHIPRGSGSGLDEYDTENIKVATPTLKLALRKGVLLNTITPHLDLITLSATFTATGQSGIPLFDPTTDPFLLTIGGPGTPFVLSVNPGDPGWKGKRGKFTWQSGKGAVPKMKVTIDTVKGTLLFSAKAFDFSGQLTNVVSNPVQVRLSTGKSWAFDQRQWRVKTTGWQVLP